MDKPFPAFPERNVPIVFSSDDAFVPYMAVMLASIVLHSSQAYCYDFLIFHRSISSENQKILSQIIAGSNRSIRFIDVSPFVNKYTFYTKNRESFTEEAYYRLLIPEILSEYEKVLYFDGDMIALTDVAELFQEELGDCLVASSRDLCGLMSYYNPLEERRKYRDQVLKLKHPDDYFITGMLIFNIQPFRETYSASYLLEFAASREWLQHDQDVLNVLCEGRTKLVSASWDVIQPELFQYLPPERKKELVESIRNPKIIHFGGAMKPWIQMDAPFGAYFWKYAAQTPYIQEIIRRRICLEKAPDSPGGMMEKEFRRGTAGGRYILKFIRAWLDFKCGKGERS